MTVQQEQLAEGVGFLPIKDTRFKTARLSVGMFLPLREETAAANAILPELMTHATEQEPNIIAVHRTLSRLYGASVGAGVQRLGDHQVLTLSITCIENRFALQGEDVVAACADLLLRMMFRPHLSADGVFDAADVEQEKRCLLERIAATVNDKRVFAATERDRLLANGEPYGVSVCGTSASAAALTPQSITDAWKRLLETAVFQWIYVGADDGSSARAVIQRAFADRVRKPFAGITQTDCTPVPAPRAGMTRMQVNQAKLSMGFRLAAHEPNVRAVMVGRLLSALFGGSPSSMLFRNVREKMSLCYYCSSRFERVKGVLTVDSGVDVANVERAKEEILRQLDAIARGEFSDEDLEASRRYVINQLRDHDNLQSGIGSWYMGQALCLPFRTVEDTVDMMRTVTREEITALAKTVTLTAVYTVLPEEETV